MKEITGTTEEVQDGDESYWFCKDCKHDKIGYWDEEPCKSCKTTITITNYEEAEA